MLNTRRSMSTGLFSTPSPLLIAPVQLQTPTCARSDDTRHSVSSWGDRVASGVGRQLRAHHRPHQSEAVSHPHRVPCSRTPTTRSAAMALVGCVLVRPHTAGSDLPGGCRPHNLALANHARNCTDAARHRPRRGTGWWGRSQWPERGDLSGNWRTFVAAVGLCR